MSDESSIGKSFATSFLIGFLILSVHVFSKLSRVCMKGCDDRHGHVRWDMIHPWFLIFANMPNNHARSWSWSPIMSYTTSFRLNLVVSMLCHSDTKDVSALFFAMQKHFPSERVSGLRHVIWTYLNNTFSPERGASHDRPSASTSFIPLLFLLH